MSPQHQIPAANLNRGMASDTDAKQKAAPKPFYRTDWFLLIVLFAIAWIGWSSLIPYLKKDALSNGYYGFANEMMKKPKAA